MTAFGASFAGLLDQMAGRVVMLRERVVRLDGWRRALLAIVLGMCATAALPPVYLAPLLFVAFPGLVWLVDAVPIGPWAATRTAFGIAWWFGFGHFFAGFYWLANALLIDAAQFGWMVPFALFGLAGGLAIFPAAAVAAYHRIGQRGLGGIIVFACAWTAAEWVRGHVLTGFPWNLIGTAWAFSPAMMQPAALVGLYGLSLLTVLAAALPATVAAIAHRSASTRWTGVVVAAALVVADGAGGAARLATADGTMVPDVRLRLVQPNVPQSLKWDPAARVANFRKSLELTRSPGFETRTDVIWSETAVPFVLTDFSQDGPAIRAALASVTPLGGLLITGAPRAERSADGHLVLWNSLFALDDGGHIVASYDKHHLVPFGEYVPLHNLLAFAKVTPGAIDFSSGPGPQTISLPHLPPASPLICYEAIFPGEVVDPAHRPAWLLNVSNDAWFGLSAGPHQHFASARFRTIEEGLPLVRATNDGISAVVDAYGRPIAELGLGETGVLDATLPAALAPTPYARWGDLVPLGLALLLLAMARVALRRE
jgi:apolipoprotein N-acyltransferase